MKVGWYVHHHGSGHRTRAMLVGRRLATHGVDVTLLGSELDRAATRAAVALAELLNADEPASALARYSRRRVVTPQVIRSGASVASGVALAGGPVGRVRDRVLSALARPGTAP